MTGDTGSPICIFLKISDAPLNSICYCKFTLNIYLPGSITELEDCSTWLQFLGNEYKY